MTPAERQRNYVERHRVEVNHREMLRQRVTRTARTTALVRQAVLKRPRCMICNKPIKYGTTGVRYDTKTCGHDNCQAKRYRWFVRRTP